MKRNLFKQMRNEWRSNIWMGLELLVVVSVVWVLMIQVWSEAKGLFCPNGFNADGVYQITTNALEKSPEFVESGDSGAYATEDYFGDRDALLERLRQMPEVEAASLHQNGAMYEYSYWGRPFVLKQTDTLWYMGNSRFVEPDYIRVIRVESSTGMPAEKLEEALARGEILLGTYSDPTSTVIDPYSYKGKTVYQQGDSIRGYRVADIIKNIRRNDFEITYGGTALVPYNKEEWGSGIILRVKEGKESAFEKAFREKPELRRERNVYLTNLLPLWEKKASHQRPIYNRINLSFAIMFFLLVTIFLGILGTFWFRVQQRIGEIAIRKVCGATDVEVFRRVLAEGLSILLVSSILSASAGWIFIDEVLSNFDINWKEYLVCGLVAVAIVAIGVVVSLWWPSRRVMHLEPAVAVKED